MIEVGNRVVEPLAIEKLEDALAEFVIVNPPGRPAAAHKIERAEGNFRVALKKAGEDGTAVMGAAQALLTFIRSSHGSRLQ